MLRTFTGALVGAVAFGGLAMSTSGASAVPMIDMTPAVATAASASASLQQARWVCGPFRCFWRPNYYQPFYPAYGYGYGYHRFGWHGGWHGGWHHGWRHHW